MQSIEHVTYKKLNLKFFFKTKIKHHHIFLNSILIVRSLIFYLHMKALIQLINNNYILYKKFIFVFILIYLIQKILKYYVK